MVFLYTPDDDRNEQPSLEKKVDNKTLLLIVAGIIVVFLVYNLKTTKDDFNEFKINTSKQMNLLNENITTLKSTNLFLNDSVKNLNESLSLEKKKTTELLSEKANLEDVAAGWERTAASLSETAQARAEENVQLSNTNTMLQSQLTQTVYDISNDIAIYQSQLSSAMEWFSSNSMPFQSMINNEINKACAWTNTQDDTCVIDLPCVIENNLKWRSYIKEKKNKDSILSLAEFTSNGGGDCEDWTLFVKAEINYLRTLCYSYSYDSEKIVYAAYESEESYEKVNIGGDLYPIGVCYDDEDAGHCVIGFSTKQISSVNDIPYLRGGPLIEPQTGDFIGSLDSSSSNIWLSPTTKNRNVYILIGDSDIYLYKEYVDAEKNHWTGAELMYQKLEETKEELSVLIN